VNSEAPYTEIIRQKHEDGLPRVIIKHGGANSFDRNAILNICKRLVVLHEKCGYVELIPDDMPMPTI